MVLKMFVPFIFPVNARAMTNAKMFVTNVETIAKRVVNQKERQKEESDRAEI